MATPRTSATVNGEQPEADAAATETRAIAAAWPVADCIAAARELLATHHYDAIERGTLRACVDRLERMQAVLTDVMAVRPVNWADDQDPQQRRAWANAAAACGWVE